jgi:hypothetical protein
MKDEVKMVRPVYDTSPTKRTRRTKAAIAEIRSAMFNVLDAENPMTVRQVFYRMVADGVIPKTEAEYRGTICRLLADMRRSGEIPFNWLADGTRWIRKPITYSSMESMLQKAVRTYRQALWDEQESYVEIWLEKDALAGVLYDVTWDCDAPLLVTRGYSSLSYLYSAAEEIAAQQKPSYLYYFGDHDPSGVDIPRKVEADLRKFAPDAEIHFERVAVLPEQIEKWNLPTRPTKKSDTRSKKFKGESVEVDAIPPDALRQLARNCIEQHIDAEALERTRLIEEQERKSLQAFLNNWMNQN